MKKRLLTKEPLRWFLLLWVAMVVSGSLLGSNMQSGLVSSGDGPDSSAIHSDGFHTIGSGVYFVTLSPRPADSNDLPPIRQLQIGVFMKPVLPLSSILVFLLLVALYSFLLWKGLSRRVPSRFFWPYFLVQSLLVLAMQWVMQEPNLALNLYLVLTLCAIVLFKRAVPALLIGMSYLLLFFVSLSLNIPYGVSPEMHLAALWFSFWSFSDLTTIVFFMLGYLLLYMQQSSSQIQLEQAHLELQRAHSRLAASARQIETLTLLTERQRIARELHDTLAQGIAGMIMQLEVTSAQMKRKQYPQAQQVLCQVLSHARTALQDARHAITDLRSRTPRADQLVSSVQEEIAHFFQTTGIECHLHLDDLTHTPAHACEHVLRFIGEGLSNVARHAQARQVSVEAGVRETWLSITVRDDGLGFDPANQALYTNYSNEAARFISPQQLGGNKGSRSEMSHYGLLGLQERANLVGGMLSVNSSDGKGTALEFRIPLTTASSNPTLPHKQAYEPSASNPALLAEDEARQFGEHIYA